MLKQFKLVCGAALFLAVAACDQSTGPSTEITQADAIQLAADMDAVATIGEADLGLGGSYLVGPTGTSSIVAPIAINNSFSFTRQCPRGGQVALTGTTVGTGDRANRNLTLETNATRTDSDCAFQTRNGVLTVDGNPNLVYKGNLNIVNGMFVGLQTQTHKGSFTWDRTGGSGTCEVDLASSFNPADQAVTVTGHFCGHLVNVRRTRGS